MIQHSMKTTKLIMVNVSPQKMAALSRRRLCFTGSSVRGMEYFNADGRINPDRKGHAVPLVLGELQVAVLSLDEDLVQDHFLPALAELGVMLFQELVDLVPGLCDLALLRGLRVPDLDVFLIEIKIRQVLDVLRALVHVAAELMAALLECKPAFVPYRLTAADVVVNLVSFFFQGLAGNGIQFVSQFFGQFDGLLREYRGDGGDAKHQRQQESNDS